MATSSSTTTTQIDPTIQPFLSYGLNEAQRLYQLGGPAYFSGDTFVRPSETTQTGLQALEQRALQGNPLLRDAQSAIRGAIQGQQNPAAQMYQNIYGQAQSNPTNAFFTGLIGGTTNPALAGYTNLRPGVDPGAAVSNQIAFGNNVNPAMAGTQQTAGGAYLGGNQFFQGAFAPAAQAATQQFQTAIGDISSAASKAGRYGSGAMNTLQDRASSQLAKSLSDTAGQLAYQNYAAERGIQENAQTRLAGLSQQDIANRMAAGQNLSGSAQNAFNQQLQQLQGVGNLTQQGLANQMAGASGLGQNYQQALATQMAATGGVGSTYASDLARQLSAAGAAPGFASADYQDIQNLLSAGQAREGYTGQQLQADLARFNFGQVRPQNNLSNFLSSVYGNPLTNNRSTSASGQTPDATNFQNLLGGAATLGGLYKNLGGQTGVTNLFNAGRQFLTGFGPQTNILDSSQYQNYDDMQQDIYGYP
jgi:hypothetical protein